MTVRDFTYATYYAISAIGYGKGFTEQEAVDNYVRLQLRNYRPEQTIFKTYARWRQALTTGEARAQVWRVPEGTVAFIHDGSRLWWLDDNNSRTEADYEKERLQ